MMNPQEFQNIARVEEHFWWFRGMNRILFHLVEGEFQARRPGCILEVGCGTGGFAELAGRRWNCPIHVVDLAMEGLRFARERGLTRTAQADIRALPFADRAFDAVLSLDVIVHLARGNELAAFAELARVLRPGGLAVVRTSALDILKSRHSDYAHERQRFTRPRLVAGAQAAGLRVTRCTYLNSLLMPVALAKFRVWEPLFQRSLSTGLEQPPAVVNRVLEGVLSSELALLRHGIDFPAGQSLLLLARKA